MLKHYPVTNPTLGLNTKYRAKFDRNNEALFNDDFDTVLYLSLPLINVVTESWFVAGSIGQKVSSTVYGRTVEDTGKETNKMHLASCELELNFSAIKGNLNGINPEIRVQQLLETLHLWLTHTRN
jgi:hypothetical protein